MMDAQTGYYHKNTLKNSRAAINRHLNDIGRSVDIVRDKEFKTANQTLDGMLKLEHQDFISTGSQVLSPGSSSVCMVQSVHSFRLSGS